MNTDEVFQAVSAKITSAIIEHEGSRLPEYFEALRLMVRRVVTHTVESGLTESDKRTLIKRLLDHVSSLEEWWVVPKLT